MTRTNIVGGRVAHSSKMMWFGFGWSGLVLGILLAADPTARSLAVIAALVAVAGGWLLLARSLVAADRQNVEADNLLAARHEIVERSGQAIVHVSSEATRQVEAMRQESPVPGGPGFLKFPSASAARARFVPATRNSVSPKHQAAAEPPV